MLRGAWDAAARGRVNPIGPVVVAFVGVAIYASGRTSIGVGVAVGAVLAYVNGLLLSRRVDLAVSTANIGGALLVMQAGLLVTMAVIGVAEVVMVRISLSMAVASAAGFGVAQIAILATYYWSAGRVDSLPTTGGTNA
jgi:hypothetical protein